MEVGLHGILPLNLLTPEPLQKEIRFLLVG